MTQGVVQHCALSAHMSTLSGISDSTKLIVFCATCRVYHVYAMHTSDVRVQFGLQTSYLACTCMTHRSIAVDRAAMEPLHRYAIVTSSAAAASAFAAAAASSSSNDVHSLNVRSNEHDTRLRSFCATSTQLILPS